MTREAATQSDRDFPVIVVRVSGGWAVALTPKGGQRRILMQPGWASGEGQASANKPYLFATEQEGWQFVRKIYRCCTKTDASRQPEPGRVANCPACGQLFKSGFSRYCPACLKDNNEILRQFCEAMYHRTGSSQDTLTRLALLLQTSREVVSERLPDLRKACCHRYRHADVKTRRVGDIDRTSKP